ncbi:Lrp/AsnC family transcriptional regulator [Mucilaginibacter ximonensis]|uniref:Lrp/AsnC family transcriptional regulator n=1 Tax=Mucilaginibacter ximonensis TaxID=538021 RepID=A0ABW5Y9E5_9SPHI
MKRIDQKDITLINILQKDARTKLRRLAATLRLTTSPVHDRILLLLKEGYIKNFKAVVNRRKFGYHYQAFVRVETVAENFDAVMAAYHEVELAYQLKDHSFLLLINTKDEKAYSRFVVERLRPLVNDFKTFPVNREIKTFARLDFEDIKACSNRLVSIVS